MRYGARDGKAPWGRVPVLAVLRREKNNRGLIA